ncbi:hypothetical protein FHS95_001918 [Sphingomonas naasensis]|uniref:Uncharacterized protein n=1 Tax=Sphingomonas naasensis TaxID=1344951 RepID=A0A4S1WM70_9SPHN|nr:hypothetical protein [Sphingomonas naasensis]NIJ20226.1 hypothetical protein [Sphingomonas naasensis]TGX44369.1 hypothetical protein E5A74_06110 [Sphingomonas naasensis]
MTEPDREYLERRLELCRAKAAQTEEPGIACVYRNFAAQYARALADLDTIQSPPGDASNGRFMLQS